jgi:hypothetical protein
MTVSADTSGKQSSFITAPGKDKIRLKFRVSAIDGVVDGIPEPQWTEKWGVGLFDYEEFHVTDQLLKLPFQENPPKTVCIFSIANEGLRFRMIDRDRVARINSIEKAEAIVRIGDRIQIGETLVVEVLLAPKAEGSVGPAVAPVKAPDTGPVVETQTQTQTQSAQARPSMHFTEAPTKLTEAPSVDARLLAGEDGPSLPEILRPVDPEEEGPTLTLTPQSGVLDPSALEFEPIFGGSKSIEIEEATADRIRPDLKPSGRISRFSSEAPVELERVPHARKDTSLSHRVSDDEDGPSFDPVYASSARLNSSEPSLSEKLVAAVSRVLRRDDLFPPRDKFPLDEISANDIPAPKSPSAPKPWVPAAAGAKKSYFEEPKIELDMRPFESGQKPRDHGIGSSPIPWIPEAISSGARLRGRAFVFLLASAITLFVLSIGYSSVSGWLARREAENIEASIANIRQDSFERGIPVEFIADKVRRMRPPGR